MPQPADREEPLARAEGVSPTSSAWQSRIKSFLAPRPAAARPTAPPQRGGMLRGTLKTMFGMLIFVAGAEVLGPMLAGVDARLHLRLEYVRFAPRNTPVFGGLNGLLLLWFLAILALWLLLRRFDIIPKDLYGAGAAAQASRRASQQTQATTLRAGPPRTRAERRHAADAAAEAAAAATKGRAKSRVATPAVATRTTPPRTPSTRAAALASDADAAHARARAEERARRRRAARR